MKRFLLFALMVLCKIPNANASHAIGGEITYKCLGTNQYQIQFKFYRDCSGIPAPSTMDIDITNSCGFTVSPLNLLPTPTSPIQISPVCSGATTTCNGGAYVGIEEWVYTGTIVLPGECIDWTFAHSESARNASITTTTVAGSNLYIYSVLNNMNGICDDSPTFWNKPIPFVCVGQLFCFNNGAYDIQGDSLTYQLIPPRTGPSIADTVSYLPGYSYLQPLISNPPFSLNNVTGEICMVAQQTDVTPTAILVSSYRNGVLIGQIERDMQFTILPCNNNLPALSGINGTASDSITFCANQQNCIFLSSTDSDPSNSTMVIWDNSIPGATTTNSSGYRDILTICWTPSNADAQLNPYTFTVTVSDDNCPYIGSTINTYYLQVDTSPTCIPTAIPQAIMEIPEWKIYPQPSTGTIHFNLSDKFNIHSGYSLLINDVQGRSVFQTSVTQHLFSIDAQTMKGIYFAILRDKSGFIVKREKLVIN